jgi:oxygen-independent coproporphyrinogen-3 oxidase
MSLLLPPLSLYIHIPWCLQKCPYCDFNSHLIKTEFSEKKYIQTVLNDLANDCQQFQIDRPIQTIFFGGGTPSLFSPESIAYLIEEIAKMVKINPKIEITLEANPATIDYHKFAEFKVAGINRLSIGIQSFNDHQLTQIGRVHNAAEALKAIEIAKQVNFAQLNLDLMFGLPQQTLADCRNDLYFACGFQPNHLSFYQLTIEPNTYFYRFPPQLPHEEIIFKQQEMGQQLLAEYGYQQYEVSAYSQLNSQCQHNLNYWQFGDYLGIGAGASGKISVQLPNQIYRTIKTKHPQAYMNHQNKTQITTVEKSELPLEFLMNQLRLKAGFSSQQFYQRTGLTIDYLEPNLSKVIAKGLLIQQQQHYYCSEKGWQFIETILEQFT